MSDYIEFQSDDEIEEELKAFGFSTRDRKKQLKPLLYKGILTEEETVCRLVGKKITGDYTTFVISFGNQIQYINPAYLKEMQKTGFVRNYDGGKE